MTFRRLILSFAAVTAAQLVTLNDALAASLIYNPVLDLEVVSQAQKEAEITGRKIDAPISQYTYQGKRHWIFPSAPIKNGPVDVFYEVSTGLINE